MASGLPDFRNPVDVSADIGTRLLKDAATSDSTPVDIYEVPAGKVAWIDACYLRGSNEITQYNCVIRVLDTGAAVVGFLLEAASSASDEPSHVAISFPRSVQVSAGEKIQLKATAGTFAGGIIGRLVG